MIGASVAAMLRVRAGAGVTAPLFLPNGMSWQNRLKHY